MENCSFRSNSVDAYQLRCGHRFAGYLLLAMQVAFGQSPEWQVKSGQAKEAMLSARYGEAVSLYRELVRAFPQNPGLAMNLGLALHSAEEYSAAVQQFQRVVKMQPKFAAASFLLGLDLLKLNRPREAIEPLQRTLQIEPDNEAARLELADAFIKSDRLSEAAAEFRSLVNANSSNTKAWLGLGLTYSFLSRQVFEHLQNSFPDSEYVHLLVGQSRLEQHQYRSAYYHYREALKRNPGLGEAHQEIAAIYLATGHADWAEIEQEKGRKLLQTQCTTASLSCLFSKERYEEVWVKTEDVKTAEGYYWLARTYGQLSLWAHSKLAELPPSAEIHQLLAVINEMRGLYPDAVREWRQAVNFRPDDYNLKKELVEALLAAGEPKVAVELAEQLLEADSKSTELRLLLGDGLLKMQLPEKARAHLEQVVALDPKNLPAHSTLASAYLRLGRPQEAIPHLEIALPLDEDGTLQYQLAQAYRSTGQSEKAAVALANFKRVRESIEEKAADLKADHEITPPDTP